MSEAAVRRAFAEQAEVCAKLASPFTGLLCGILARVLDKQTSVGRRVLGWSGPPDALHDNVPLRLTGGLHALVRSGAVPGLGSLYPPAPLPDEQKLADAVTEVLQMQGAVLLQWLDRPPQTNEVGRSAMLMSGLLAIAARFDFPMRLHELGASAGLNLQLERYGYTLGGRQFGPADSPLQLRPKWKGDAPPRSDVRIAGRMGVDRDPLDAARDGDALLAYVWPDQPDRLARLGAALGIAAEAPLPPIEKADAGEWIERRLPLEPEPGITRVILHSIAFQYFSSTTRDRVRARIEATGAESRPDAPLAWLRFEMLPGDGKPSLRLRTWPGDERLLAWAHPHGSSVEWLGC